MNDLRSLEGIGELLSQKLDQNHRHRLKSKHIRRKSSVPMMISSPTPRSSIATTPICEYFPAEIASLLSNNIQTGYFQPVASQAPVLLKSHSDFVREDTDSADTIDSYVCYDEDTHMATGIDDAIVVLNLLSPPPISREVSTESFTVPVSLAPLVLDDDDDDDCKQLFEVEQTPMIHEIVDYLEDEEDHGDVELIDLKRDFMEYQCRNTKHTFNNIGNGASGIVRKAFHYKSCKMVAIKQCRSRQKHEQDAFIKEGNLYNEFKYNDNIVNILGFGKNICDAQLCIALEYMDLGSIDTLDIHDIGCMKQREGMVEWIMYNVLCALEEIHSNLYVHNDVKPANILSNKYGDVKLSDFGTVLSLSDKYDYLTRNNGTQRYQAPEKLTQQTKYNAKADIWSLGLTCYELLFGARNDSNDLSYIVNPPKLSPQKHKLSANCCDFIAQCLIFDDKERPSAQQLLKHKWFKSTKRNDLTDIWPWLCVSDDKKKSKKHHKRTSFGCDLTQHEYYNEDLLFMISALIINYSKQKVNLEMNEMPSEHGLHRRVSHFTDTHYSDDERIANMAHYALCSKEMVLQRIRVTVAYIKSQLNKAEVSRIDS